MFRVAYFILFGCMVLLFMGAFFKPLVVDSRIPSFYKGLLVAAFTALVVYAIKRIAKLEKPKFSQLVRKFIPLKKSTIDNAFWEAALDELNNGSQVKSLWAKCIAESSGNSEAAKSIYLRRRAGELNKSAEDINEASHLNKFTRPKSQKIFFEITSEMKIAIDELIQLGCNIEFNESSLTIFTPNGKNLRESKTPLNLSLCWLIY